MARDLFYHRIQKGLIGPGSENWGMDTEEEIISDYPLVRYFSGVLFPEKEVVKSESDEDDLLAKSETEEPNVLVYNELEESSTIEAEANVKEDVESETDNKSYQNHFNPNNIGVTFCLDSTIEAIEISFSGGFYFSPNQSEIKIKMPETGYAAFIENKLGVHFKNILQYEDVFNSLTKEVLGDKGEKNERSGDDLLLDGFKKTDNYKNIYAKYYIQYFDKLIGRTWKRKSFIYSTAIKVKDTLAPIEIPISQNVHAEIAIGYNVKTYQSKGNKYVKIQLVNLSKQSSKRFTNKTPELNQKCLFQAAIKVNSHSILPFKSDQELNPFDLEAEELNLLYRDVKSYGIGHNCSVDWNFDHTVIQTTFLPEYNIKDTKNDFKEYDFINPEDYQKLNTSLGIRTLSIFSGLGRTEIKKRLFQFVELYGNWIGVQKEKLDHLPESKKKLK